MSEATSIAAVIEAVPTKEREEKSQGPLEVLAAKLRVKAKRGEDGERIIPGKLGHIYEHGGGLLGLLFMPPDERSGDKRWTYAKRQMETAGFEIWQDGDYEGSALFNPTNLRQARLAVKLVRAKRRRVPSPAQMAAARKGLEALRIRRAPLTEGEETGKNGGIGA